MRVWSLCCLVALLAVSSLAAQAYRLQFKDAQGISRQYSTKVVVSGNVSMGTLSSPLDSTMKMTAVELINAVANGKSSVTYSVTNGTMSTKLPNILDDATQQGQDIEQAMPDFSMDFDRTPFGKISNLKMNGEANNLFMGLPNEVNNRLINPGDGLEFPNKDLQPGDTWSGKSTVPLAGDSKVQLTANYTLVGTKVAENGKTYLQVDVDLTINIPKLAVNAGQGDQAMSMDMAMNLKGKETVLFDELAGELYQSSCKMAGTVTVTAPGQIEAMPMTLSTNILVKKTN